MSREIWCSDQISTDAVPRRHNATPFSAILGQGPLQADRLRGADISLAAQLARNSTWPRRGTVNMLGLPECMGMVDRSGGFLVRSVRLWPYQ